MNETRLLDTNVLLRFFTGEPPKLAAKAHQIIAEADAGRFNLEILPLVVSETIYTLESFYEMPKKEVCDKLLIFLQSRGIIPRDKEVIIDALKRYRTHNVHFVDACIAAYGVASNISIHSFDRDFKKFKDVDWKQ